MQRLPLNRTRGGSTSLQRIAQGVAGGSSRATPHCTVPEFAPVRIYCVNSSIVNDLGSPGLVGDAIRLSGLADEESGLVVSSALLSGLVVPPLLVNWSCPPHFCLASSYMTAVSCSRLSFPGRRVSHTMSTDFKSGGGRPRGSTEIIHPRGTPRLSNCLHYQFRQCWPKGKTRTSILLSQVVVCLLVHWIWMELAMCHQSCGSCYLQPCRLFLFRRLHNLRHRCRLPPQPLPLRCRLHVLRLRGIRCRGWHGILSRHWHGIGRPSSTHTALLGTQTARHNGGRGRKGGARECSPL